MWCSANRIPPGTEIATFTTLPGNPGGKLSYASAGQTTRRVAAEDIEQAGFANMCPVSTVAGEVANADESLRLAAASVFGDWITLGTAYFESRGVHPDTAREVIIAIICALAGAFVMTRTLRDAAPLLAAGAALAGTYHGVPLTGKAATKRSI